AVFLVGNADGNAGVQISGEINVADGASVNTSFELSVLLVCRYWVLSYCLLYVAASFDLLLTKKSP
ncbi:MAG: hypothetical protein ACI4ER_02845, partial [Suilimivivens sp.]